MSDPLSTSDTAIGFADFDASRLDAAVALSQAAGWPHRHDDWAMLLGLGRGLVALDGDRVVGTVLTVAHGEAATICVLIVDERLRGRGIGRALMERAIDLAGTRECRLVATADGLPLYRRLGFVETGGIAQHGGAAPMIAAPAGPRPAGADEIARFVALDREACGMDRTATWAHLAAVGRFAVIERAGAIRGVAALRDFGRGEVIGPIVAERLEDAEALVEHFLAGRAGRYLRVDTPEDSGLSAWLAEIGLPRVGGGIAMQRNARPRPIGTVATFGLVSQALG
jgi:GNAT superfamily N-acetyltransferase